MAVTNELWISVVVLLSTGNCLSTSASQIGCDVPLRLLPHGIVWLSGTQLNQLTHTHIAHNSGIKLQCTDEGYEMYSDGRQQPRGYFQTKTCQNGTLVGPDVECATVRCSCNDPAIVAKLRSEGLKFTVCEDFAEHNDFVNLVCISSQDGRPSGQQDVQCHQGEWEAITAKCQDPGRRSCKIPSITNALFYLGSNQVLANQPVGHDDAIEVTCETGYLPVQNQMVSAGENFIISCQDGSWLDDEISCTPVRCDCDELFAPPALIKRYVKPGACNELVNHGEEVKVECTFPNMVLSKPGFVKCDSGQWRYPNDEELRCAAGKIKCQVPEIENAIFHIGVNQVYSGDVIPHDKSMEIKCDDGYSPDYLNTVYSERLLSSCMNGHWSHHGVSCVPADCRCEKVHSFMHSARR